MAEEINWQYIIYSIQHQATTSTNVYFKAEELEEKVSSLDKAMTDLWRQRYKWL